MQACCIKILFIFSWGNRFDSPKFDDEQPPAVVSEPKTPYEYFLQYYGETFWEECAYQTNLYSVQERSGRSVKTDAQEMKVFAGMHIMMGILKLPRVRIYWSQMANVDVVSQAMPRNRFFELRSHLHFADKSTFNEEKKKENRLFLVEPVLNCFREACLQLPRSQNVCVDEQMVPFSGRCPYRQYVPSKPNPLGLKNFVMASADGLVLDFLIYVGKGTVPDDDMKQLGLGASVVKRLVETGKMCEPTFVFTDRYFTGIKLADYLLEKKMYLTGTVMANRTGGVAATLAPDKSMERGESNCKVRSDENICIVKWKDTKSVLFLSTAFGTEPEGKCKRWAKDEKKKVDIPQPDVVGKYNANMGGVDLIDRYVSYYRIQLRTRKWTLRVFAHFLDLACCNGWVEYRRDCEAALTPKKDRLDLLDFKANVANVLLKAHPARELRSSMSSDTDKQQSDVAAKRSKVTPLPPDEVRYDQVGHFPQHEKLPSQMKCRYPGCGGKSRVRCLKCDVFLCLQNRNCFLAFHTH